MTRSGTDSPAGLLDDLFHGDRRSDIVAALLIFYLGVTAVLLFWEGRIVWAGYAAAVFVIASLPAAVSRDVLTVPPVEIVLLATVPFTLQLADTGFIASHTMTYLSAAAVALLIIAELTLFTSFRTTPSFTVVLLGLTTMAIAGVWAIVRWAADLSLGTAFIVSEEVLMWEFATAALAGLLAGGLFTQYVKIIRRRRDTR